MTENRLSDYPVLNLLTWKCGICGDERPDKNISVISFSLLNFPQVTKNLKYCNDRGQCYAEALYRKRIETIPKKNLKARDRWELLSWEELMAKLAKKKAKSHAKGDGEWIDFPFRIYCQSRLARRIGFCQNPKCGSKYNLTADHIIPLSVLRSMGFNPENSFREEWYQCLCKFCNICKSDTINWSDPRAMKLLDSLIQEKKNEIRKPFSFRSSIVVPIRLWVLKMWAKRPRFGTPPHNRP